jgi:hypothetical protein
VLLSRAAAVSALTSSNVCGVSIMNDHTYSYLAEYGSQNQFQIAKDID